MYYYDYRKYYQTCITTHKPLASPLLGVHRAGSSKRRQFAAPPMPLWVLLATTQALCTGLPEGAFYHPLAKDAACVANNEPRASRPRGCGSQAGRVAGRTRLSWLGLCPAEVVRILWPPMSPTSRTSSHALLPTCRHVHNTLTAIPFLQYPYRITVPAMPFPRTHTHTHT